MEPWNRGVTFLGPYCPWVGNQALGKGELNSYLVQRPL